MNVQMKYQINEKFAFSFNFQEEDQKPEYYIFHSIIARFDLPIVLDSNEQFKVNHEIYQLLDNSYFSIEEFEMTQTESTFVLVDNPTGAFNVVEEMEQAIKEAVDSIGERLQSVRYPYQIELLIGGVY